MALDGDTRAALVRIRELLDGFDHPSAPQWDAPVRALHAVQELLATQVERQPWPDGVEVLACPFCGGLPPNQLLLTRELRGGRQVSDDDAFAYSVDCGSCAARGGWAKSATGAIRRWNMRTTLPRVHPTLVPRPESRPPDMTAAVGADGSVTFGQGPGTLAEFAAGVLDGTPHRLIDVIRDLATRTATAAGLQVEGVRVNPDGSGYDIDVIGPIEAIEAMRAGRVMRHRPTPEVPSLTPKVRETLDDPRLEAWRAHIETEDPWVVAAWATSDLSEDHDCSSWGSGAGAVVQQLAAGRYVAGWSVPPDGEEFGWGLPVDSVDVALLGRILERLEGRWPEYPPDGHDWFDVLPRLVEVNP